MSNKRLKLIGKRIKDKLFMQGLNASHAYLEGTSDIFSTNRDDLHSEICQTDKSIKMMQSQILLYTSLPKFASEASLLITLALTLFISSLSNYGSDFIIGSLISVLFIIFKLLSAVQTTARSFFLINSNQSLLVEIEKFLISFKSSAILPYLNLCTPESGSKARELKKSHKPLLTVNNLRVNVNSDKRNKFINFKLCDGDILCLNAPSGSGKSRIFFTLSGILPSLEGSIDLNIMYAEKQPPKFYNFCDAMQSIYKRRPSLLLLSAIDIKFYGNIEAYLRYKNLLIDFNITVKMLSEKFKLDTDIFIFPIAPSVSEFLNTPIASLSGGQLQRLLIFVSLLQIPNILLLDEATSNLDVHSDKLIMNELRKYLRNCPDSAIIFTSHSITTRSFATKTISF